jgi:hypothetical protein
MSAQESLASTANAKKAEAPTGAFAMLAGVVATAIFL